MNYLSSNLKPFAFCITNPHNKRGWKLGEVFTPKPLVDTMITLAEIDKAWFDKTVFEPGAGTGNFTAEILWKKLDMVEKVVEEWHDGPLTFGSFYMIGGYFICSLLALASITFNDIDPGNIKASKQRLFDIMIKRYLKYVENCYAFSDYVPDWYNNAIKNILSANAICTNLLKDPDSVLFVRYKRLPNNKILRSVYNIGQLKAPENAVPLYEDTVAYDDWKLEIAGADIEKLNANR